MVRTDPLSFLSEQIESWKKAGTYQTLRQLQTACQPVCRVDGKEVINLASNNYLGLADSPELIEAAAHVRDRKTATSALLLFEQRAGASGTDWGLGLLAAARALLATDEDAEAA